MFKIKLTSMSLLRVPVQRRSSPVTGKILSTVFSTCPPPMSTPSFCRDFDRPKVSLKAELFNCVHVSGTSQEAWTLCDLSWVYDADIC